MTDDIHQEPNDGAYPARLASKEPGMDRTRIFEITSAEGESFFVEARSYSEAFNKFRRWEDPTGENDFEEPQMIRDAGWLIMPPAQPKE